MGKELYADINNKDLENPEELYEVIMALKKDIGIKLSKNQIESKYSVLIKRYPSLYSIMTSNKPYRMEILERMISSMKLIRRGLRTQEEMDKEIGFLLAQEYVYPNIDMSKESNSSS